jgi:hypothetical protein
MKDNFDVHSWNRNRIMENSMDDADRAAKQRVDIMYNQLTKDFPECFESSMEKATLRFSIASAFTELSLSSLNEETEDKKYEVEYWVYKNDNYEDEEITIWAKSEEEALAKAKEENYKGKNFKILKR